MVCSTSLLLLHIPVIAPHPCYCSTSLLLLHILVIVTGIPHVCSKEWTFYISTFTLSQNNKKHFYAYILYSIYLAQNYHNNVRLLINASIAKHIRPENPTKSPFIKSLNYGCDTTQDIIVLYDTFIKI